MFIDTHAHLDGIDDVTAAIKRAQESGVTKIIAIGGEPERNLFAVKMAEKFSCIKAAVGYDRDCVNKDVSFTELRELLTGTESVVAIGESGLDFFYHPESESSQIELFERNLALANEFLLPVVVHSRNADKQTVDVLRAHIASWKGDSERVGVLHCFTGNEDFLRDVLELGLYISFSGIVTFKNADALRDVVRYVPDDRILVETDSPYLAPIPHRGSSNEPAYLVETAKVIAGLKNMTVEDIADITTRNAGMLFGLAAE